jgi:PAS domain S-box-containing protein
MPKLTIGEKALLNKYTCVSKAGKKAYERIIDLRTRQLEQKNAEMDFLFHNATMGIVVVDSKGEIVRINPKAERKFRYEKNELIGKNIDLLIPKTPTKKNDRTKYSFELNSPGRRSQMDLFGITKSGTKFPVEVSFSPYFTSAGKFVIVFIVDITMRKRDELLILEKTKELRRSQKVLRMKNASLKKMNEELETFTFISSHDLQEPLRKIKNFVAILLEHERSRLTTVGKGYLERTYDTANRMQGLIEDLLSYTRAKNADLIFELLDLKTIVEEVLIDKKESLEERNAIVSVNIDCKIRVIPFQFRQLISNLVSNAIKFSGRDRQLNIAINGEIKTGIDLNNPELLPEKKYCHLSVTDNGIGFDPVYKKRIFEVFQRLHSFNEYKGTGIGLAICKRITENHNGVITATAEIDKGARFDIYLPV